METGAEAQKTVHDRRLHMKLLTKHVKVTAFSLWQSPILQSSACCGS